MTNNVSASLTTEDVRKAPWVRGLDQMSDAEWAESNPDGHELLAALKRFDVRGQAIGLAIQPLRNLVKLALRDFEDSAEAIAGFVHEKERFLAPSEEKLAEYRAGIPQTVEIMIGALRQLTDSL